MTKTSARTVRRRCPKCDGRRIFTAYAHVSGGVCFTCHGAGTVDAPADWREREARNARRRKAREAARLAADQGPILWAEFVAAHPREAAIIDAGKDRDETLAYAYGYVVTYDRRDSHPDLALQIFARWEAGRF